MDSDDPILSFVAMFDFLGFKSRRKIRGTSGLHSLYTRALLPLIQHSAAMRGKTVEREGRPVYVPDPAPYSVACRVISDSILLFANGNTFDDFLRIVSASHNLLCGGFGMPNAPLRGAIGYGELILDDSAIWIGSAIEDAYEGESKQVWSGCAFTKTCIEFVEQQKYLESHQTLFESLSDLETDEPVRAKIEKAKRRIVKYQIPEQTNPKTGPVEYTTREGYALDWTLNVFEGASRKIFSEPPEPHAQRIVENTGEFEKWARQKQSIGRHLFSTKKSPQ
jgi:hypothetical protein